MRVHWVIGAALAAFVSVSSAGAQTTWPPAGRLPNGAGDGTKAEGPSAAAPAAASAAASSEELSDDQVIATVGGEKVTYGEIRRRIGTKISQKKSKYLRERREAENDALDKIINRKLVTVEARRRNISERELLDLEIEKKVAPPTEDELKKTFEQVKERVGGTPYEEVKPQLIRWLSGRKGQEVRAAFFASLREKGSVSTSLPALELPTVVVPEGGNPAIGPADAPIKVVIWSDFECPFCSRVVPTIHALEKKYRDKIRIVFRDFPLDMHENARRAHEAGGCAHDQNKFWAFHDHLFANQEKLTEKDLVAHARTLGLDVPKFEACMKAGKYKDEVQRDLEAGTAHGVNGTPAVFINGTLLSGAQPLETMVELVESFLKAAKK